MPRYYGFRRALTSSSASTSWIGSGRLTLTRRQRHCSSWNVRRKRCAEGSTTGADASNLPTPYSAALKTCQMVPTVLLFIPIVPGGGSAPP